MQFLRDSVSVRPALLTILVDHRERSSGVVDALHSLSIDVRESSLEVADYIVACGVGVERKTVRDLHRSIVNRRLWAQVASLRIDMERPYLIVEGTSLDAGPISQMGIRGALLEVMRLGIPVLRSADAEDSALWLVRLAGREARDTERTPRNPSRTRYERPVRPTTLLAEIPGISPKTATALIDRFGSVAGVSSAQRRDLMTIPGIGPLRAATIHRLLNDASSGS